MSSLSLDADSSLEIDARAMRNPVPAKPAGAVGGAKTTFLDPSMDSMDFGDVISVKDGVPAAKAGALKGPPPVNTAPKSLGARILEETYSDDSLDSPRVPPRGPTAGAGIRPFSPSPTSSPSPSPLGAPARTATAAPGAGNRGPGGADDQRHGLGLTSEASSSGLDSPRSPAPPPRAAGATSGAAAAAAPPPKPGTGVAQGPGGSSLGGAASSTTGGATSTTVLRPAAAPSVPALSPQDSYAYDDEFDSPTASLRGSIKGVATAGGHSLAAGGAAGASAAQVGPRAGEVSSTGHTGSSYTSTTRGASPEPRGGVHAAAAQAAPANGLRPASPDPRGSGAGGPAGGSYREAGGTGPQLRAASPDARGSTGGAGTAVHQGAVPPMGGSPRAGSPEPRRGDEGRPGGRAYTQQQQQQQQYGADVHSQMQYSQNPGVAPMPSGTAAGGHQAGGRAPSPTPRGPGRGPDPWAVLAPVDEYGLTADARSVPGVGRGEHSGGGGRAQSGRLPVPGGHQPGSAGGFGYSSDESWEGDVTLGQSLHGQYLGGGGSGYLQPQQDPRSPARPPMAETMQGRLEAAVMEAMKRHVATWDVRDVCNWVEAIGFPQYRRKFAHNSVDGALLISLTDDQMRTALGILPLGHREALRNKVKELKDMVEAAGQDNSMHRKGPGAREHPRGPASASPNVIPPDSHLGPAQGKITVKEQRNKLMYELDRTVNKSAQAGALLEQIARQKDLTEQEAKRLRGQLMAVEAEHKLLERRTPGKVDPETEVPWRPNNFWTEEQHPERHARRGEDPALDMTFSPRITRIKDLPTDGALAGTLREAVTNAFKQPGIWKRMEMASDARTRLKEKREELEHEEAERQQMAELQGEADDLAARPNMKKAAAMQGYWVPNGVGYNHKKPKGQGEAASVPDLEAKKLSDDIKFLEKKFRAWNHADNIYDPEQKDARRPKVPYPKLLEAIDDFIDALMTPKNEVVGAFPTAVKAFFRESNLDLEPRRAKAEGAQFALKDPFLHRISKLKGIEQLTELDKVKLRMLPDPPKPTDVEKERRALKIRSAAGLIHMAEFVAHAYGRRKAGESDSGSGDEDDEEAKKRKAAKDKKGRKHKIGEWTAHGPFVPNGILERNQNSAKAWDTLSKRVTAYKKKVGVGAVTIDPTKVRDEQAKAQALDKDVAKADQFFQLLGWHHAAPPPSDQPHADITGELINRLLRRALYLADLRDHQLDMVKEAKAQKTEVIKELTLQLSRLQPGDPRAKEVQRKISKVKAMSIEMEPLPPVDWEAMQWREDGLQDLQEEELRLQRQALTRRWEKERNRKRRAALKAAQRATMLEEVVETDWQRAEMPDWDVEDAVLQLDYLSYCVRLLGQLPSQELRKFLKMPPSGLTAAEGDGRGPDIPADDQAAGGLNLARYDGGDEPGAVSRPKESEEERERRRRMEEAKALKAKKLKVFRALCTLKFVEFTDNAQSQRDKRMQETLAQLEQEHRGRKKVITREQQDGFFQRLLDDIQARRNQMEERANQAIAEQLAAMTPFKARPFSARSLSPRGAYSEGGAASPGVPRSRSRSPSPYSGSMLPSQEPSAAQLSDAGGAGSGAGSAPGSRGGSPAPRQGGGFAYWYATGATRSPRPSSGAGHPQQQGQTARQQGGARASQQQQQRPSSAPRVRSGAAARAAAAGTWVESGGNVPPAQGMAGQRQQGSSGARGSVTSAQRPWSAGPGAGRSQPQQQRGGGTVSGGYGHSAGGGSPAGARAGARPASARPASKLGPARGSASHGGQTPRAAAGSGRQGGAYGGDDGGYQLQQAGSMMAAHQQRMQAERSSRPVGQGRKGLMNTDSEPSRSPSPAPSTASPAVSLSYPLPAGGNPAHVPGHAQPQQQPSVSPAAYAAGPPVGAAGYPVASQAPQYVAGSGPAGNVMQQQQYIGSTGGGERQGGGASAGGQAPVAGYAPAAGHLPAGAGYPAPSQGATSAAAAAAQMPIQAAPVQQGLARQPSGRASAAAVAGSPPTLSPEQSHAGYGQPGGAALSAGPSSSSSAGY